MSSANTELPPEYQNEIFNYDSLGNRLSNQSGSSAYDESSQRLTRDFKYDYFYDNNGNLIKKAERVINGNFTNYDYSSENQLIKVSEYKNGSLVKISEYSYDALGRRTNKEIKDFEKLSEFSRKYLYHGQDILAKLDESNSTLAVYTLSTLRIDDVLSVDVRSKKFANTEGSYFFLKDDLGSIVDITDSNGTVVQHYTYSAFGRILGIKDGIGNDITGSPRITSHFTYTGREFDSETGLYYYRARYYDPSIGRFLTEDPGAGRITYPNSFNSKFSYVLNNSINNIDPLGLFSFSLNRTADVLYNATLKGWHQGLENFWNKNQSEIIAGAIIIGAVTVGGPVAAAGLIVGGVSAGFTAYGGGNSSQIAKSFIGGFAAGALTASFSGLVAGFGSTAGTQMLLGTIGGAVGGVAGTNVGTQITSNR